MGDVATARKWLQLLGLTPGSKPADIAEAYKNAQSIWHPDRHTDTIAKDIAEKRFLAAAEAHRWLIDNPGAVHAARHSSSVSPNGIFDINSIRVSEAKVPRPHGLRKRGPKEIFLAIVGITSAVAVVAMTQYWIWQTVKESKKESRLPQELKGGPTQSKSATTTTTPTPTPPTTTSPHRLTTAKLENQPVIKKVQSSLARRAEKERQKLNHCTAGHGLDKRAMGSKCHTKYANALMAWAKLTEHSCADGLFTLAACQNTINGSQYNAKTGKRHCHGELTTLEQCVYGKIIQNDLECSQQTPATPTSRTQGIPQPTATTIATTSTTPEIDSNNNTSTDSTKPEMSLFESNRNYLAKATPYFEKSWVEAMEQKAELDGVWRDDCTIWVDKVLKAELTDEQQTSVTSLGAMEVAFNKRTKET